jgi:hypothetical protein
MVQFGDGTYDEERAVEKLFRCIPEKSLMITRSIKSLQDLSTMSIEEAIGRFKIVDGDEPQPLSGPITVGEKLHLTREQWEVCQGDGKKGESPASMGGRKRGKWHKSRGGTQAGAQGRAEGSAPDGAAGNQKPTRHGATKTVTSLTIGPRSVDSHNVARPTSHRWRRRSHLYSWHMKASSYLQRHRSQRLSSTLMS